MLNVIQNISPTEYAIIALILIVLFGGKITKMLARFSGQTLKEVKHFKKEFLSVVEGDDKNKKS